MRAFYRLYRYHFRSTLFLSTPIIIGQIGFVMMGVIDNAMIGHMIGKDPLAAVGAANAIFFLVTVFGMGTISAVAPLVSIAKSKNGGKDCFAIFRKSQTAALLLSALTLPALWLCAYNFHWFGQEPVVTELAGEYLFIVSLGVLPFYSFWGGKQFTEGLSFTKPAMVITIAGLLLNVILNWIMIEGNLGFPRLELAGAGIATTTTRVLMTVGMFVFIWKSKLINPYREHTVKPQRSHLNEIFKIGLPSGFQYFFEVAAFATAAILMGWISKEALAAHNIALNMAALSYMVTLGISAAGSIRVGDYFGKEDKKGVYMAGTSSLLMIGAFMVLTCIMFIVCNEVFSVIFIDAEEQNVIAIAASLLVIAGFFQMSDGIQGVALGILRGITDVKIPTAFTLFSYWVVGLPLAYYLAFKTPLGPQGIWWGLTAGLTCSAILLTSRFYYLQKGMRKKGNKVPREKITR